MKKTSSNLAKALSAAPKAKAQWQNLTPVARRDFSSWIDSAKQPETRQRRLERTCSMLAAGKRRPCCYSRTPLSLYTALNDNAKAQAQWKKLTPGKRRDLVDWIESAGDGAEARQKRAEKAALMLAAGKLNL